VVNADTVCSDVNFFGDLRRSANAQGQLNLTTLKRNAVNTW
jgi:hypothetical protein